MRITLRYCYNISDFHANCAPCFHLVSTNFPRSHSFHNKALNINTLRH